MGKHSKRRPPFGKPRGRKPEGSKPEEDKEPNDNVVPMPGAAQTPPNQPNPYENLIFARGQLSVLNDLIPILKRSVEKATVLEQLSLSQIRAVEQNKDMSKKDKELEELRAKVKELEGKNCEEEPSDDGETE